MIKSGADKEKFVNELEQLNYNIRMIDQKLAVKTDHDILHCYQVLENELIYASQSIRQIKLQLNTRKYSEHPKSTCPETKKTAIV